MTKLFLGLLALLSVQANATMITLSKNDVLEVRFNLLAPAHSAVDMMYIYPNSSTLNGDIGVVTSELYDGTDLLGTYTGATHKVSSRWKTLNSIISYAPYEVVDFSSILDGTIDGLITTRISGTGTITVDTDNYVSVLGEARSYNSWAGRGSLNITSVQITRVYEPIRITDFSVASLDDSASIDVSNTIPITRYALQSSTNLNEWTDAQFRLARSSRQAFEMSLPTDEDSMFFRVAEEPFNTGLLATGKTTKLFSLSTYNPVSPAAHWMTCNQEFIATGIGVLSSIQSSGFVVYPPTITNSYTITADGSVSDVLGAIDTGLVNLNGDLQVSVDGDNGWAQMIIALQSGGNDYTTSDLEGFWEMYTLTVADNVGDYVGWGVSEYHFDAGGIGTPLSTERSDGSTDLSPSVTFSVNSDGSISGGPPGSTWFMSQDKNLIVTVMGDGGDGVTLGIMVRDEGSGCKTADIAGQWRLIQLTAADDSGDWAGWQSAVLDISANGYVAGTIMERSDGSSIPIPAFSLWVADEGTVNGGGWEDSLLSLDKDLVVGIGNDMGGGLALGLMLRN